MPQAEPKKDGADKRVVIVGSITGNTNTLAGNVPPKVPAPLHRSTMLRLPAAPAVAVLRDLAAHDTALPSDAWHPMRIPLVSGP